MVDATHLCWHMLDATPMHHDGVGGVGMVTFGELAHMVDATHLCWHMLDATPTHHDGVGGMLRNFCASPPLHTWSMLRNLEELEKLLWQKENVPLCCY